MYLPNMNILHLTVSKIKSRSNYDVAQLWPGQGFLWSKSLQQGQTMMLHPLTNVPTKYQLSKPCGFRDMARKRFFKVKVITVRSKVTFLPKKSIYMHMYLCTWKVHTHVYICVHEKFIYMYICVYMKSSSISVYTKGSFITPKYIVKLFVYALFADIFK